MLLLLPALTEVNRTNQLSQESVVKFVWRAVRRLPEQNDGAGQSPCETIFTLPTPSLLAYTDCVNGEAASADLGVPGVDLRIRAECACQHKVFEAVEALGCCEHPDFRDLCLIDCNADCTSELARQCVEQCPAICLEQDYAPSTCLESCTAGECHRQLLCITANAVSGVETGNVERVCHERLFAESSQMKAFHACQVLHPHRSVWQRQNAAKHCICDSKLGNAVEESDCCGTSWGKDICSAPCSNVDCESTDGKQCLKLCPALCEQMESISQNCYDKCFEPNSSCSKFDICPPARWPSHGYVCDDGSEPLKTGCCVEGARGGPAGSSCPLMCDSHRSYPIATAEGDRYECFCEGCPPSIEETQKKFHRLLENELHANGQSLLNSIAQEVGLKYPTRRMQDLMDERNAEIMKVVKSEKSGYEKEKEIGQINDAYVKKIKEAGRKGPDGKPQASTEENDGEKNIYLIVAISAVVVAGVAVGAAILAVRARQKGPQVVDMSVQSSPSEIQRRADALRQANDAAAVVVGQPVGDRVLQGQAPPQGVVQPINKVVQ